MDTFDVSPTIGSLHRRMTAVGTLKISYTMSMHDSNMSLQLLRRPEHTETVWALQRHIDVTSLIMSVKIDFVRKGLFAAVVLALKGVF